MRWLLGKEMRFSRGVVRGHLAEAAIARFGGFVTILILAEMTSHLGHLLLIAPFGASCVLVFALPQSPLAQPRNVIGGHLVSAAIGLVVSAVLGPVPLSYAIGVGCAIAAMSVTGRVHPPAGADPIVVIMASAGWSFLIVPVFTGAVTIVLLGWLYRKAIDAAFA